MRKQTQNNVMDMSFMMIFDVIIGFLGIYLVYAGVKCTKNGTLDTMIVTADEQIACKDATALSKYLMPKTAVFGGFCILFGLQGLCNDMGCINFPSMVNSLFLIAFVVVWILFSYFIRTGKKKYIH